MEFDTEAFEVPKENEAVDAVVAGAPNEKEPAVDGRRGSFSACLFPKVNGELVLDPLLVPCVRPNENPLLSSFFIPPKGFEPFDVEPNENGDEVEPTDI